MWLSAYPASLEASWSHCTCVAFFFYRLRQDEKKWFGPAGDQAPEIKETPKPCELASVLLRDRKIRAFDDESLYVKIQAQAMKEKMPK